MFFDEAITLTECVLRIASEGPSRLEEGGAAHPRARHGCSVATSRSIAARGTRVGKRGNHGGVCSEKDLGVQQADSSAMLRIPNSGTWAKVLAWAG
jgi:hypothetical protein